MIKIIECPRDAMQGIVEFIPTEKKLNYIQTLVDIGFDTIDVGSFVSEKAIPQMRDTALILDQLQLTEKSSKLLCIVANLRGAKDAVKFPQVKYLGYPFSISETFQQRNTNSSIAESLLNLAEIQELCLANNKELVVYISMAFGNPYGDPYSIDEIANWTDKLARLGIKIIAFADTVGVSTPENIEYLFSSIPQQFSSIEFGAHLHARPEQAHAKIEAAVKAGCTRIDAAIKGFGGCPMAGDDLTGNIATEQVLGYLSSNGIIHGVDKEGFNKALIAANDVFLH